MCFIGNVYNIGTDFEISNLDVAKLLLKHFKKDEKTHIQFVENRPFNDCRYKINSDKLLALGWKPVVTWEEGIKRTSTCIFAPLCVHTRACCKVISYVSFSE